MTTSIHGLKLPDIALVNEKATAKIGKSLERMHVGFDEIKKWEGNYQDTSQKTCQFHITHFAFGIKAKRKDTKAIKWHFFVLFLFLSCLQ